jgi:hypothetical protein
MKKIAYYLSVALVSASVLFTSCKKKEDDPAPAAADVTLEMVDKTDAKTLVVGARTAVNMTVRGVSSSDKGFSRLYVYQTIGTTTTSFKATDDFIKDSGGNYYYDIPNSSSKDFSLNFTVNTDQTRSAETYAFKFMDNSINVVSGLDGTITLLYGNALTKTTGLSIAPICSAAKSAYDITNLASVSVTVSGGNITGVDANADIAYKTSGSSACTAAMGGVFSIVNGGNMVKYSGLVDLSNYTDKYLSYYHSTGTVSTSTTTAAVGDQYIIRVKGTAAYALMTITKINDGGTAGDYSDDRLEFSISK